MMHASSLLTGLGVGAGLMFFLDPQQGRRRRKLALDQFYSAICEINDATDATWRDVRNRSYGTFAELQSAVSTHDNADPVVQNRVRSKLGRYVSHPHAIDVQVKDGHVALFGPILASEVEPFVSAIKSLTGVKSVENHLDVHESAGNISALQGGRARRGECPDILQENWAPATRLMLGTLGSVMAVSCVGSRNPVSLLLGTLGMGLLSTVLFTSGSQSGRRMQPGGSSPQQPTRQQGARKETQESAFNPP